MHAINLAWKEFNLDLTAVDTWMRANASELYLGNSADSSLNLWFSEDPGPTIVAMCNQYWDGLNEESPEALSYVSRQEITDAITALRSNLHTKTWDAMSTAERKLVTGQMPTKAELGL